MPNPRSNPGRCVGDETDARPLLDQLPSYVVGLSAKRDEPDAWHLAQSETSDEVTFRFGALRKPYAFPTDTITVSKVHIVAVGASPTTAAATLDGVAFGTADPMAVWATSGTTHRLGTITAPSTTSWPDELVVTLTEATAAALDDLLVVLELTVT